MTNRNEHFMNFVTDTIVNWIPDNAVESWSAAELRDNEAVLAKYEALESLSTMQDIPFILHGSLVASRFFGTKFEHHRRSDIDIVLHSENLVQFVERLTNQLTRSEDRAFKLENVRVHRPYANRDGVLISMAFTKLVSVDGRDIEYIKFDITPIEKKDGLVIDFIRQMKFFANYNRLIVPSHAVDLTSSSYIELADKEGVFVPLLVYNELVQQKNIVLYAAVPKPYLFVAYQKGKTKYTVVPERAKNESKELTLSLLASLAYDGEIPITIESPFIEGIRQMQITCASEGRPPKLVGTTGYVWDEPQLLNAKHRERAFVPNSEDEEFHYNKHCTCGVNIIKRGTQLEAEAWELAADSVSDKFTGWRHGMYSMNVWCNTIGWGNFVEHEQGWRVEHARITHMYVKPDCDYGPVLEYCRKWGLPLYTFKCAYPGLDPNVERFIEETQTGRFKGRWVTFDGLEVNITDVTCVYMPEGVN